MKCSTMWSVPCRVLLASVLILASQGCHATSQVKPAAASPTDCMALQDVTAKQACMATSDDFKNCLDTDLRCAPYRQMHALENQLFQTNAQLVKEIRRTYASLKSNDPAYLDNLEAGLHRADTAWRAWREADCAVEPLTQGMSHAEVPDLVHACRVDRSLQRLAKLEQWRAALSTGR